MKLEWHYGCSVCGEEKVCEDGSTRCVCPECVAFSLRKLSDEQYRDWLVRAYLII